MLMKHSAHYYCRPKIKSCNISVVQFTQRSIPFVLVIWHMVPDKFKRVGDYKSPKQMHLKEFVLGNCNSIISRVLFCLQVFSSPSSYLQPHPIHQGSAVCPHQLLELPLTNLKCSNKNPLQPDILGRKHKATLQNIICKLLRRHNTDRW